MTLLSSISNRPKSLPPYRRAKDVPFAQRSTSTSDDGETKRSFSLASLRRRSTSSELGHRSTQSCDGVPPPPLPTIFSGLRNLSLKRQPVSDQVPALDSDDASSAASSVLHTPTNLSTFDFPNPKHYVVADDVFIIAAPPYKRDRRGSTSSSASLTSDQDRRMSINYSKPFSITNRPISTSSDSSASSFDAPSIWSRPSAEFDSDDDESCYSSPVLSSRWSVYSFGELEEDAGARRLPLLELLGLSTKSRASKRESTSSKCSSAASKCSSAASRSESYLAAKKHYSVKPLPSVPAVPSAAPPTPTAYTPAPRIIGQLEEFPSPPKRRIPSVLMPSPCETPRRALELFAGEERAIPAAPKPLFLAHPKRTLATDFFDLL